MDRQSLATVAAASILLGAVVGFFGAATNSLYASPAVSVTAQAAAVVATTAPVQRQYAGRALPALNNAEQSAAEVDMTPATSQAPAYGVLGAAAVSFAALAFALSRRVASPASQALLADLEAPRWAVASTAAASKTIYVVNGFYMSMREKYTQDGAAIMYMLAEWDSDKLSWKDFRGKVLGATDPVTAPEGSIRRTILETYKDLDLATEPNVGDNGVHASASPFEALVERMNWIGAELETDDFGAALLKAGIPKETILAWTKDPQVEFEGQKRGLFDVMEDLNVQDCLKRAQTIAGVSGPITATKNQAFVFVKPHAMTPQAIELAKAKLTAAGIKLGASGRLDNKTIESKMLIDNHYYAIANKASLTKPKDLSPPAAKQDEFAALFGEKWADVLAAGRVFNALDACKELGIGGNALDGIWGKAKKAGKLVKFGGGFYVGQLEI